MSIESPVARVTALLCSQDLRQGGVLYLPQRIAVIAQGASSAVYSTDKFTPTSAAEVGAKLGYGSPAHLAAKQLLPANGDGVGTIPVTIYPLLDAGSGVAAEGAITPTGSPTSAGVYRVSVNNILSEPFVIPSGATIAQITVLIADAIQAVLDMPVTATSSATAVTVTAKWAGASGNGLKVAVLGEDHGVTLHRHPADGRSAQPERRPCAREDRQLGRRWS